MPACCRASSSETAAAVTVWAAFQVPVRKIIWLGCTVTLGVPLATATVTRVVG